MACRRHIPTAASFGPALALAALLTAAPVSTPPTSAQEVCATEAEPNDHETDLAAAPPRTGAICYGGSLPGTDQDLFLWELTPEEASGLWSATLDGVRGTLTTLQVYAITSDPGTIPVVAGSRLVQADSPTDAVDPITAADLFFPAGRYLVGVTRSDLPGGGSPPSDEYSLSIAPGSPLPPSGDAEPNDREDEAGSLEGSFSISGDLEGTIDTFNWNVTDGSGDVSWALRGQGLVGAHLSVQVRAPDGTLLLNVSADPLGRLLVPDLRLPPARYSLALAGGGNGPSPYVFESTSGPVAGDPEPNDARELAVPVDLAQPLVRGRLAPDGDRDYFRVSVADGEAPVLREIKLIWTPGLRRELCLSIPEGPTLSCRDGDSGVVLSGVLLRPGDYLIGISGEADADVGYILRFDPTTAPAPDFEAEPNDMPELATTFDTSVVMHGRGAERDRDLFLLDVAGEAQLWDVTVRGTAIDELAWLLADGTQLATGELAPERTSATLPFDRLRRVPGGRRLRAAARGTDAQQWAVPVHDRAAGPVQPERRPGAERRSRERAAHAPRRRRRGPGRAPFRQGRVRHRAQQHQPQDTGQGLDRRSVLQEHHRDIGDGSGVARAPERAPGAPSGDRGRSRGGSLQLRTRRVARCASRMSRSSSRWSGHAHSAW